MEKGSRDPEKGQNFKTEQSRRILQNTLTKPKQLRKLGMGSSQWRRTTMAVSRKPKETSFQKEWSVIFNAVQQPVKIRIDHCPLITSDFNKGLFQGGAEILVG